MKRAAFSARGNHLLLRLLPFLLLSVIAALTGPGCRGKDNPVHPIIDTTTTPWRLVLRAPEVMYIDTSGHVNYDTITVRLYDQLGHLHAGTPVLSVSLDDPGKVTAAVVSSVDTVHRPWGTSGTPLMYWGIGAEGGQERHETVSSWVIVSGDTVARATASFIIRPQPMPQ
jgi:hypothetical protein